MTEAAYTPKARASQEREAHRDGEAVQKVVGHPLPAWAKA